MQKLILVVTDDVDIVDVLSVIEKRHRISHSVETMGPDPEREQLALPAPAPSSGKARGGKYAKDHVLDLMSDRMPRTAEAVGGYLRMVGYHSSTASSTLSVLAKDGKLTHLPETSRYVWPADVSAGLRLAG